MTVHFFVIEVSTQLINSNFYNMLSVCIPIYNWNVTELATQLFKQLKESGVEFEILLVDDASDSWCRQLNSKLDNGSTIKYIQNEVNMGRSRIRNFLGDKALYDYLLFMDCDARVPDNQFIQRYLTTINQASVIAGGCAYEMDAPDPKHYLRWFYGVKREQHTAEKRNKKPYTSFSTFNFLAPKSIFKTIRFNEQISQYGHEDTLFGVDLEVQQIKITHIDNPLYHIGLEDSERFLQKSRQSLDNLLMLVSDHKIDPLFCQRVKVLRYFSVIKKYKVRWMVAMLFYFFRRMIESNLKGNQPQMKLFDFYKLGYLCSVYKNKPPEFSSGGPKPC